MGALSEFSYSVVRGSAGGVMCWLVGGRGRKWGMGDVMGVPHPNAVAEGVKIKCSFYH